MGFQTFPEGIFSKENIITRLEFELAYCDIAVQHISPYATGNCLMCSYLWPTLHGYNLEKILFVKDGTKKFSTQLRKEWLFSSFLILHNLFLKI